MSKFTMMKLHYLIRPMTAPAWLIVVCRRQVDVVFAGLQG